MENQVQKSHTLNGLFLAQEHLRRKGLVPCEVLPLNYNYQDIRIVTTKIVKAKGTRVVIQTSGCDCGPQPCIRAGLVKGTKRWDDSMTKSTLESGEIKGLNSDLCRKLSCQSLVKEVFLVAPPGNDEEKGVLEEIVERACPGKRVRMFSPS